MAKRKYSLDEDYFKVIDTPRKAYWLGLIYADGNVQKYNFSLGFKQEDRYMLEALAADVSYGGDVSDIEVNRAIFGGEKKIYRSSVLRLCSRRFVNNLVDKGVEFNKTFRLIFPDLDNTNRRHFVRGLYDGDGFISITNQKGRSHTVWGIVGQERLLHGVNDVLVNELNIKKTAVRKMAAENCWTIRYATHFNGVRRFAKGRLDDLLEIRKWLYFDADCFFRRKKDIFDLLQTLPVRSGLSMKEAAERLGIGYSTFRYCLDKGMVNSYREGMYRRISQEEVERFQQQRER